MNAALMRPGRGGGGGGGGGVAFGGSASGAPAAAGGGGARGGDADGARLPAQWQPRGVLVSQLRAHAEGVRQLVLSPDGGLLFSRGRFASYHPMLLVITPHVTSPPRAVGVAQPKALVGVTHPLSTSPPPPPAACHPRRSAVKAWPTAPLESSSGVLNAAAVHAMPPGVSACAMAAAPGLLDL